MNTTKTPAALTKFANSDLNSARREGEIAVCDTAVGTVFVRFESGVYSITSAGLTGRELVRGTKAAARAVLMALYVVEPEYTELSTVCGSYEAYDAEVLRMIGLGYTLDLQGSVPGKSMRMTRNATAYTITY